MEERLQAWIVASKLVDVIVDKHGLEKRAMGGNFLIPSSVSTPVEQHLDQIIYVADWLLDKDSQ